MRLFSADSTHWYTREGTPMHTVKDAKGEDRPTNLRDARKLGLLPSVTNITGIIQKEGISQWKMDHCVTAALTLPRLAGEDLGAFAVRVAEDAEKAMSAAANFGTMFHAGAQRVAENPLGLSEKEEMYEWLREYRSWMEERVERVIWTEKTLVNRELGYAGTADLLCVHREYGLCLVDLKTQGIKEKRQPRIYPGWQYQLAAYARILGETATCMNLVVNSTKPAIDGEHVWSPGAMEIGWDVFQAAHFIWRHEKGYSPGTLQGAGILPCSSEPTDNERSTSSMVEAGR